MRNPYLFVKSVWQWLLNLAQPNSTLYRPVELQQWLSESELHAVQQESLDLLKRSPNLVSMSSSPQQGSAQSRRLGTGFEYAESQVYQPGDDIRFLDWRLMAKKQQAYTKWFEPERLETWCVLLDSGETMRFGTRQRLKIQQALYGVGFLSLLAEKRQAQVQLIQVSRQAKVSAMLSGRQLYSQIMALANPLESRKVESLHGMDEVNRFANLVNLVPDNLPQHAQLVLLSDCHGLALSDENVLNRLAYLAQRFSYRVVFLEDPAERQLPTEGRMRLSSMTSQDTIFINASQKNAFEHWAVDLLDAKKLQLEACGIRVMTWRTEQSLQDFAEQWSVL